MNLDKTNLGGKTETWVIFMLKIFVLQKLHVFSTLNLRNNVFIEFISENFLVFLSTYQRVSQSILQKKIIDSYNEDKIWRHLQNLFNLFSLKIKKRKIQEATFIHSEIGMQKWINLKKMNQKRRDEVHI